MVVKHGIEWLNLPGYKGETWNPHGGCTPVSEGCANCWAVRQANRFKNRFRQYEGTVKDGKWTGVIGCATGGMFYKPLRWRAPRAIFPCSMGDFFHPGADEWRERYWHTIYDTPQHLYLILTKRPERIPQCLPSFGKKEWPWKNVWLGATVENQEMADKRAWALRNVPATKRFLSIEPMLGPVNLLEAYCNCEDGVGPTTMEFIRGIHWVIAGGESGPGARPMHPAWPRSVRDQCLAARVPYFHKQNGEWLHESQLFDSDVDLDYFNACCYECGPQKGFARVGKKQAGHLLDGCEHKEFPL